LENPVEPRALSYVLRLLPLVAVSLFAQSAGDLAYDALRAQSYDLAVAQFTIAVAEAPKRSDLRKDFAYTLLKVGDTPAAREQFAEAMRLDPADDHVALEYAFLCYETPSLKQTARRVFDRLRAKGNATAAEAFENVDRPLRDGIARWRAAVRQDPNNFSAHEELAKLAEQRDEFVLAAEHYEAALQLRPARRDLLLDLGRVWSDQGQTEKSLAALIAASRATEPRIAETAKALLPARYPYVYEFEQALALDPSNEELRRELAYLHQEMGNRDAARREFEKLPERALVPPKTDAPSLLNREPAPDDKAMAERSLDKGYLPDAARYLRSAYETDPGDFDTILKLGWTYNALKQDN
jgi:Tfp pilus assembly protein PilF